MAPITEFLDVIIDAAESACQLDSPISLEELSAEGGLYAETGEGFTQTTYFNKTEIKMIPVLFMCRHKDQRRCLEQLEAITNHFQKLTSYPSGTNFTWLDAEVSKYPSKIGRDEDGMYHYSCILNCKLHF